ncbi:hypothetical protein QYF36_008480 [Acer negundo]|nr:hypothetical protein QYF36_008480 [Acer negundo]
MKLKTPSCWSSVLSFINLKPKTTPLQSTSPPLVATAAIASPLSSCSRCSLQQPSSNDMAPEVNLKSVLSGIVTIVKDLNVSSSKKDPSSNLSFLGSANILTLLGLHVKFREQNPQRV